MLVEEVHGNVVGDGLVNFPAVFGVFGVWALHVLIRKRSKYHTHQLVWVILMSVWPGRDSKLQEVS